MFINEGVSLADVDEFAQSVVWPKSSSKLRKNFFQTSVVHAANNHLRAFAGETLSAIAVLGKFTDAVVKPLGVARDHVECFDALRNIIDLLGQARRMLPSTDLLKRSLADHHEKFRAVYPRCCKPKLHLVRHVPQSMDRFGVELNCFATERKHKKSKRIAEFAYRNRQRQT